MPWITRLLIAATSLMVMLVIFQLVRKKKLDERYALLWIFSGVILFFAPLSVSLIDRISRAIGIQYPPAFIFLLCFFALFIMMLQYSVSLSRFYKQNRILAQRLAVLENLLIHKGEQ